jgi:hypothetical protein
MRISAAADVHGKAERIKLIKSSSDHYHFHVLVIAGDITHDSGFNCIVADIDSRADYCGGHFARPTMFGDVSAYDLVLYVAIHAAAGTPDAFFPKKYYAYRRLMLLLYRSYYGIKHRYFAPRPNAEGAVLL